MKTILCLCVIASVIFIYPCSTTFGDPTNEVQAMISKHFALFGEYAKKHDIYSPAFPGQTNFYTQVSSLWFEGKQQMVFQIAQQRLSRNPNDLAGLILKAQYEGDTMQLSDMTNTLAHAVRVGSTYTGTNFAQCFPVLESSLPYTIFIINSYTPENYAADLVKTNIPGKTMDFDLYIRALQNDNYFEQPQQATPAYPPQGVGSADP